MARMGWYSFCSFNLSKCLSHLVRFIGNISLVWTSWWMGTQFSYVGENFGCLCWCCSNVGDFEEIEKAVCFLIVFGWFRRDFGVLESLNSINFRHHIVDEREEMRKAFDNFMKAKGPEMKFMGGEQPNLGIFLI